MPPAKTITLRFESKDGQFRLNVTPQDHFTSLLSPILDKLPRNVDSTTITLSNRPFGGEERLIHSLKGVTIERVGLS